MYQGARFWTLARPSLGRFRGSGFKRRQKSQDRWGPPPEGSREGSRLPPQPHSPSGRIYCRRYVWIAVVARKALQKSVRITMCSPPTRTHPHTNPHTHLHTHAHTDTHADRPISTSPRAEVKGEQQEPLANLTLRGSGKKSLKPLSARRRLGRRKQGKKPRKRRRGVDMHTLDAHRILMGILVASVFNEKPTTAIAAEHIT